MTIAQSRPAEAKQLLEQGYRYLDVRTEMEFANGHAAGAINIPVAIVDQSTRRMALNPDFLRVVEAILPKDQGFVVGCQAGSRSQHAAEMMATAGYAKVVNLLGGWGGGVDPRSGEGVLGWVDSGYAICRQCDPDESYAELLAKAG